MSEAPWWGLRTPSFLMMFEGRTLKERKRTRLDYQNVPKIIDLKADENIKKKNISKKTNFGNKKKDYYAYCTSSYELELVQYDASLYSYT